MRLSEKTIELNICAQINAFTKKRIVWFGLTQAQEAKAGFDAATKLNGRLLLIQFKASNKIMKKTGARRFQLEHDQLQNLINRVRTSKRSVYYAFPDIGTTSELQKAKGDILGNTRFLDVSNLPNPYPSPTTNSKPIRVRSNNKHYADLLLNKITIHSDPLEFNLSTISDVLQDDENVTNNFDFNWIQDMNKSFTKNLKVAIIY